MTVKGNMSIKRNMSIKVNVNDNSMGPYSKTQQQHNNQMSQNGSSGGIYLSKSPPRDSNLNHHKADRPTPSRPKSIVSSPDRKEREFERERDIEYKRERKETESEKKIARDVPQNASDPRERGDAESDKKMNKKTGTRERTNSSGKMGYNRSMYLSNIIYPIITDVSFISY